MPELTLDLVEWARLWQDEPLTSGKPLGVTREETYAVIIRCGRKDEDSP